MTMTFNFIWGAFQDTQGRRAKRKYFKTVRRIKQQRCNKGRIDRAKTGILRLLRREMGTDRRPAQHRERKGLGEVGARRGAGSVCGPCCVEQGSSGVKRGWWDLAFGAREHPCCWVVKGFEVCPVCKNSTAVKETGRPKWECQGWPEMLLRWRSELHNFSHLQ